MQQEDDLRALAKIMDFLRAVSIILVVMNVYWYCYATVEGHGINIGVVDRILLNFNREAGLFHSVLYTKLFALLLLALSCLGTKGVINEKITWPRIWAVLGAGFVFYFIINWWMLLLPIHADVVTALYILTIANPHDFHWLHLPDDGWSVDEQTVEVPSDGGRFQQRKRELSAGNTADGERVFRQPAYPFLLQEEMEQRLD